MKTTKPTHSRSNPSRPNPHRGASTKYDFTDTADDVPTEARYMDGGRETQSRQVGCMIGAAICGISAMVMVALFAWLFLWATEARAHQAQSGINYPARCCWSPQAAPAGRPGDCDEIPAERVRVSSAGYVVTLYPGDHPMVKEPITFVVPYEKVENSIDGAYHVCFKADMTYRCFFAGGRMG